MTGARGAQRSAPQDSRRTVVLADRSHAHLTLRSAGVGAQASQPPTIADLNQSRRPGASPLGGQSKADAARGLRQSRTGIGQQRIATRVVHNQAHATPFASRGCLAQARGLRLMKVREETQAYTGAGQG